MNAEEGPKRTPTPHLPVAQTLDGSKVAPVLMKRGSP